jgi:hypothetical protein
MTPTNMAGTKAAAFGYMAAKPGSVSRPLNSAREHNRIRAERPGGGHFVDYFRCAPAARRGHRCQPHHGRL